MRILEGQRPDLENIANKSALAGQRPKENRAREDRWVMRGLLWNESNLPRLRSCGRHSIAKNGLIQVRANGQSVGYAGLASCGSVWACPTCNARIQGVRRLEVGILLQAALETGSAAFGTMTLRHFQGQDWDLTWRGLSKCWDAVSVDKSVRNLRKELGWLGFVRAAECTLGAHGLHPHLHLVHFFAGEVSEADIARLHAAEFRAWKAKAERIGLEAPLEVAQDMHLVTGENSAIAASLGDYFTKATFGGKRSEAVAWEMTSTQTKTQTRAKESITPWELLSRIMQGDADALDDWHRWEKVSKGKRAISYSRGLRQRFGLLVEATDEEIAAAEIGSESDTGFEIEDWSPIRANPRLGAQLLGVVTAAGNWSEGRKFCADNGIPIANYESGSR